MSRHATSGAPGPPRLALRTLEWFCRGELLEEIRGDLEEAWEARATGDQSQMLARLLFWKEVLLFVRPHTLKKRRHYFNAGLPVMWKNYLRVALRSIRKHKTYSAINYAGLAVGLACTILILIFVRDELSYDAYHDNAGDIYRLVGMSTDEDYDGIAKINGPWGIETARQVPAVQSVARFVFFGQALFERGDRREFVINPASRALGGFFADSTTFDVFSWRVVSGDAATALVTPNSLVVTESFAERWFGNTDPVGETIRVGGNTDYRVTAVMQDVPRNSHFRFDFLASMSGYGHPSHDDWWRWNQYYTYLRLSPGADPGGVERAVPNILAGNVPEEGLASAGTPTLQPLREIYLRSNMFREIADMGDLSSVTTFSLLAVFILLIAAVNFVNLSTARSSLRAREVGVRKSLGAVRGVISRQFVYESVLTSVFAGLLALLLIFVLLPSFNELAGKAFSIADVINARTLLLVGAVAVGVGLLSGVYPALVLSSYDPVRVLKGAVASRGPLGLRKGLVVLQFAISGALIMSTGIVSDQLEYIREKPLGFNAEFVTGIPNQDNALVPKLQTMKARMQGVPGVQSVALSGNRPGGGDWGIPIEIPGRTREETPSVRMLVGDQDFTSTYDIDVVEGRGFVEGSVADFENGLLINQEMARQLGWDEPIGMRVEMPNVERSFEVIGVVRDFHFRSVREAISPLMIFQAPDNWYSMFSVRLAPDAAAETIDRLSDVYAEFDAVNPMQYSFMDAVFDRLYDGENRTGALLRIATLLAIVVACLGLFGLAAFTVERRTREIGIRKVVGASSRHIVEMLTRETSSLVAISLVPAVVAAVWFGRRWLSGFAYHAGISEWTLAVGAAVAVGLAVATSGLQAWRAARMNPAKTLRVE